MPFSKKRRGRKRRESKRHGRKRRGKKRNANPLQRRQRRDWRLCNRRLPAPKELVWRQCGLRRRVSRLCGLRLRVLRRSVKPPYRKQPCGQTLNARTQLASFKVPRAVLFFAEDELATTGTAKIKTADLRKLAGERLEDEG